MVRGVAVAVGAVKQRKEPRILAVMTDAFAQFDGHAIPAEINFSPPASPDLTLCAPRPKSGPRRAGMVKRYHGSFPSFSYEFDSRYPLQKHIDVFFQRRCFVDYAIYQTRRKRDTVRVWCWCED